MAAPGQTMSDVLRMAIFQSGKALIALEWETGAQRMSIARFISWGNFTPPRLGRHARRLLRIGAQAGT
jgi:hypothetical protein